MTPLRRAAVLAACVVLLATGQASGHASGLTSGARAGSAADARAEAQAAADRVTALEPRVTAALRAYDESLRELSGGVSRSLSADQAADEAAAGAAADRRSQQNRVRSLYISGGTSALVASVLTAADATDALRRVSYVQRLVGTGEVTADTSEAATLALRTRAASLQRAAEAGTVTAAQVQRRYDELTAALAAASAELASLSEQARTLEAAEAAAARIAALNAAVDATGAQRVATAKASATVRADYQRLYLDAAATCKGMEWPLLAAIGQVESGHGANTSNSYAGAQGPMQFLPSTFASYAVDGDRDGDKDIQDPADAIFTASRYLCANGAGRDEASTTRAVWHYNHAQWYVDLVLKLAGQYAERGSL